MTSKTTPSKDAVTAAVQANAASIATAITDTVHKGAKVSKAIAAMKSAPAVPQGKAKPSKKQFAAKAAVKKAAIKKNAEKKVHRPPTSRTVTKETVKVSSAANLAASTMRALQAEEAAIQHAPLANIAENIERAIADVTDNGRYSLSQATVASAVQVPISNVGRVMREAPSQAAAPFVESKTMVLGGEKQYGAPAVSGARPGGTTLSWKDAQAKLALNHLHPQPVFSFIK